MLRARAVRRVSYGIVPTTAAEEASTSAAMVIRYQQNLCLRRLLHEIHLAQLCQDSLPTSALLFGGSVWTPPVLQPPLLAQGSIAKVYPVFNRLYRGVTSMGYPHAGSQKLTRAPDGSLPQSGFSRRRSNLLAIEQSSAIVVVGRISLFSPQARADIQHRVQSPRLCALSCWPVPH